MDKEFSLEAYLKNYQNDNIDNKEAGDSGFDNLCVLIRRELDSEFDSADDEVKNKRLQREKGAIIGYENETRFFKEKIREILRDKNLADSWYPIWYPNLVEGLFAEIYGLSGLAPWAYDMDEKYKGSSSAKLIGDRLYCLIDGVSVLQPQRINEKRRIQLKRALLLSTPRERTEYGFHEVYLHNGIRITIFSGERTKKGQDIMVFRKYVLKNLTFEKLAEVGTIPFDAIALFKSMIKIGYNVIFAGQVRSGKTTFLQTWQRYEDPRLEGLAIATDPETPWHTIMPSAPIMQLIADGKELETLTKSLLRGDNDYVLLEEMRDAVAFNLALDITSTGTMRSKATIHDNDAINIPYKMATKIKERYGGDSNALIAQVYKNFDYIFEFCQDEQKKDKKLLKGIIQLSYNREKDTVLAIKICKYDFIQNKWLWNSALTEDKEDKATSNEGEYKKFSEILNRLAKENYIKEDKIIRPAYYESRGVTNE